jgi:hypothetical protein
VDYGGNHTPAPCCHGAARVGAVASVPRHGTCAVCSVCNVRRIRCPRYLHVGMAAGVALVLLGPGNHGTRKKARDSGASAGKTPSKKTQ